MHTIEPNDKPSNRALLGASLALTLLLAVPTNAAPVVHPRTQAKNLVRVLTYDRNFNTRFSNGVTIGVLYKAGDPASKTLGSNMHKTLAGMGEGVFPGWVTQYVALEFESVDTLAGTLHGNGVNVLYVSVGLDEAIDKIAEVARMKDVVTIGATREYVSNGLSFGIVDAGGKSAIVVNRSAARGEGTKFSAQLLRVAEVVD